MEMRQIKDTDMIEAGLLIKEAFTNSEHGYGGEAELVEAIRCDDSYVSGLDIVAVESDEIVGYGLLSKVMIKVKEEIVAEGLVLAPLAVRETKQGVGVGTALLTELEKRAKELGYPFISILGDPQFYSKIGYTKASEFDVHSPYDVPEEFNLIKELKENSLDRVSGVISYAAPFSKI